ncbi:MAG TPA: metallophosphoesterase [Accumulibacter sp.]|jgi:hypothetical protein|nr:metallophosphoesterase [Accumulibacter sp.]HQC80947.1 metallophosphoesterase [Accumulibacter sp.]
MALFSRRRFKLSRLSAWFRTLLARWGYGWGYHLKLGDVHRLGDTKVRVPLDAGPIEITLGSGRKKLHLYQETQLNHKGETLSLKSFIVVDPFTNPGHIDGFLRLTPKNWLSLGKADAVQQALFRYPETVADQHLALVHGGDAIVFRNLSEADTGIGAAFREMRWVPENRFRRLREIFGGPIDLLPNDQALRLLEDVNRLLRQEEGRPVDDRGLPGGLLIVPDTLTPIVLADMHARLDNLLTVLSQNAFLDALEEGSAALIILGDAVHSEVDGQLDEMASSMLMMDFIFRLKRRFPAHVFYLRGNHDSFSENMVKSGVQQGRCWANALTERRGDVYRQAMDTFYQLLPYVVVAADFVACHAAPPMGKVTREMLVQLHRHPQLQNELITNRSRRPERPHGYGRRDVKRFRRSLDLDKNLPFIVGHTPIDSENTFWLNVDGMEQHHVLYSAKPEQVGLFTRVGGVMIPLVYPVDSLQAIINRLTD